MEETNLFNMIDDWELYHITLSVSILLLLFAVLMPDIGLPFSLGLFFVSGLHYYYGEFDFTRDVMTFSIGSLLAFIVIRFFFSRGTDVVKQEEDINKIDG